MTTRRPLLLGLLGAVAAGCSTPPPPTGPVGAPQWPAPPEQPRFVFEATLRNGLSVRDDSSAAQMRRLMTGEDDSRASFGKPLAVAAGKGRVYVTDTEGRRVFVFDFVRRRTFSFGLRFEGELKKPAGIALDGEGRVYVVDTTARRVVVFDALGLYLGQIDGASDWVRPTAVAVDPAGERVYVVDTGGVDSDSHRIWRYGDRGRGLGALGQRGSEPGAFNLPTDAVVARDGTLWVLDAGNFRVQAFDPEGHEARQIFRDVAFMEGAYDAVAGADAMVILTEWDQFRALDLDRVRLLMRQPVVIDLRNVYKPHELRDRGFTYASIGRA